MAATFQSIRPDAELPQLVPTLVSYHAFSSRLAEFANVHGRSPKATNDSTVPGIFLSQEANLEESHGGEIFYVPRPSEGQASDTGAPNDLDSDFDAYWVHKGWTRLHPPDRETSTFDRAVAHSHCLDLFHRFARARYHDDNEEKMNPTTLQQLLRALELRQVIYQDACTFCNPPPRQSCRMARWQHCFFGAQEAGWGQEAWRSHAGDELYCADPIRVPRLKEFTVSYDEMPLDKESAMQGPANKEIAQGPFDLPIEIFEHVCWCLDLRSVCAIRSTCHRARERLAHLPTFWRVRTIDMHGDWFWELSEPTTFPPRTTNWMQLLWQIEFARAEILRQAGFVRGGRSLEHLSDHQLYEETIYRPMLFDYEGRPKLPLGLKNRLRIWCCLQSIGKDGTQIKLPGQKKGLDLPNVEWDGASNHANCPSCGCSSAISFNRMRMIARGQE